MKRSNGFSLTEILFCIFFGSLLLSGLIQQYSQVHRQNNILDKRLLQSLDLQLLSELLRNSIRGAGFTPCGNLDNLEKVGDLDLNSIKITPNSIEINRMGSNYHEFFNIADAMQYLDRFSAQNKLMITDCYHVALFDNNFNSKDLEYVSPVYIGEFIREKYWLNEPNFLYYKFKHAEKITDNIKFIKAELLDKNYVQVNLVLVDDSAYKLIARIRSR